MLSSRFPNVLQRCWKKSDMVSQRKQGISDRKSAPDMIAICYPHWLTLRWHFLLNNRIQMVSCHSGFSYQDREDKTGRQWIGSRRIPVGTLKFEKAVSAFIQHEVNDPKLMLYIVLTWIIDIIKTKHLPYIWNTFFMVGKGLCFWSSCATSGKTARRYLEPTPLTVLSLLGRPHLYHPVIVSATASCFLAEYSSLLLQTMLPVMYLKGWHAQDRVFGVMHKAAVTSLTEQLRAAETWCNSGIIRRK